MTSVNNTNVTINLTVLFAYHSEDSKSALFLSFKPGLNKMDNLSTMEPLEGDPNQYTSHPNKNLFTTEWGYDKEGNKIAGDYYDEFEVGDFIITTQGSNRVHRFRKGQVCTVFILPKSKIRELFMGGQ